METPIMTLVNPITEMTPVKITMLSSGNTDYDTQINHITEMTAVNVPYVVPWKHRL